MYLKEEKIEEFCIITKYVTKSAVQRMVGCDCHCTRNVTTDMSVTQLAKLPSDFYTYFYYMYIEDRNLFKHVA
jgi:hypothetical protein